MGRQVRKKYCAELSRECGFKVNALPAKVGVVAMWLHALRTDEGVGPSDLQVARAAIGYAHSAAQFFDPTDDVLSSLIVRRAQVERKKAAKELNGNHIEETKMEPAHV